MADNKESKVMTEQTKDDGSGSNHKQKTKEKTPKEKQSVVLPQIRKNATATVSRCPMPEHDATSANGQDNPAPEYGSPLAALGPMQQQDAMFCGHGFLPMPFMLMGPPQWPWLETEEEEVFDEEDDKYIDPDSDHDQDDTSQTRPHASTGPDPSQTQIGQLSALLAGHHEKCADEQGEDVTQELADLVNSVWTTKHANESISETL